MDETTSSHTEMYSSTAASPHYNQRVTGLFGRYDHVYTRWEDLLFRKSLARFFQAVFQKDRPAPSQTGSSCEPQTVRVLDLGCGTGKGIELLSDLVVFNREASFDPPCPVVELEHYTGIDLSPGMIDQARAEHGDPSRFHFEVGDLSTGLPDSTKENSYHIYFSSYGTLSHLDDSSLGKLINDIHEGMGSRSIFVMDLLGRYSPEWPGYWSIPSHEKPMLPYSMSHIRKDPVEDSQNTFPMRFWGREELDQFVQSIADRNSIRIKSKYFQDRSLFTGRHMNTRQFNAKAPPLRTMVNSLFEPSKTTELKNLLFPPEAVFSDSHGTWKNGNPPFKREFLYAWNCVILEAMNRTNEDDSWKLEKEYCPASSVDHPSVQIALSNLEKVFEFFPHAPVLHPRAEYFEVMLAHILRNLESSIQEGTGAGHSLLAFYEFEKADGPV